MGHTLRKWLAMASWVGLAWLSGCGGGGGDDPASPPPSPPPATVGPPVVDSARSSSAAIGPAGGTLRTTAADGVAYTLTVPPRALTETVTIRMTPIVDINNPALANGLTGAVQFEPSGLRFARLATLRIGTVGVLPAGSRRVGFSSASDGSRIQLSPPIVRDGGIEILVPHFSNAGAADLTPVQLELVPLDPDASPDSAVFWFEQMLAANGNVTALFLAHAGWFDAIVVPVLRATPTTDDSALEALLQYDQWRSSVDEAGTVFGLTAEGSAQLRDLLAPLDARAKTALVEILRAAVDADLAVCQSSADVAKLSMASLFQQQAARLGLDTAEQGLDRAAFLRKVNDCLRPVLDPARLPESLRVGQPQSLDLRAQVVLNGQPNPVGVPFEFTITPTDATLATPVGFSDGAGRFTTVYTPSTTAPTFNVRACLVLNDANGTTGSDICVTQQVRAEANVFAGTITVTHDFFARGQSSVTAFVRVRVNADNSTGEVIEASGTHSYNFPKEAFCVRADGSNFTVPLNDSGIGTVTAGTFSNVRGGELTLLGVVTKTIDGDRDLGAFCDIATVITTTPANSPEPIVTVNEPIKVFEGGRLLSLDYSGIASQTGSIRTVTGVLLPEK